MSVVADISCSALFQLHHLHHKMNGFAVEMEQSSSSDATSVLGLTPLPVFPPKISKANGRSQPPVSINDFNFVPRPASFSREAEAPLKATSTISSSLLSSLAHSSPLLSLYPTTLHTSSPRAKVVEVQCKARTRVPTPHGSVFLHIYHNNIDNKEHLAIVVDAAQLEEREPEQSQSFIRSQSLDAEWHEGETDMERLIRGAYVGRLTPSQTIPSKPPTPTPHSQSSSKQPTPTPRSERDRGIDSPIPIVRIHSECYTGETIGSMRCDCGEQLDEAIRYISQPQPHPRNPRQLVHGRGAVIYMRQEGRGIGLLEKIRAYNLQDMGHDTVSANLLLGHEADERGYDVAAAIMRDLGLDREIRLLTNNPDKMEALRKEGITVKERLPMIPRTWTTATRAHLSAGTLASSSPPSVLAGPHARVAGATMIGGGTAHGVDLEKYLRTKVLRMGHLLELPTPSNPQPTHEIIIPSGLPSAFEPADSPVLSHRPLQDRYGTQ